MAEYLQLQDNERIRWAGSGSSPVGRTPFGFYDSDTVFVTESMQAAKWAAERLGYPIVDIELIDINFYACFEESISEYSAQVNQFNIRNNLNILQGSSTQISATQKNIQGIGLPYAINISKMYGTETGTGGYIDWKKGYINVNSGSQTYDMQELWGNTVESGSRIEIKRVFHNEPSAVSRIYDPYSMTGMSYSNILNEMGFAGYSPAVQFLSTPIFEDMLRIQQIEFNDMVRKSQYSFEIVNNKIKIFPYPTREFKLWFEYIVEKDRTEAIYDGMPYSSSVYYQQSSSSSPVVSDYSNAPYTLIPYSNINSVGRQWILKYFLALCKEVLGAIRQKYQTIPIPGSEVTLDGSELRSEATAEKEALITQLRENLEETTRSKMLEKQANEVEQLQKTLASVPLFIYIG